MSVNAGRASAQSRDSNISPMADSGAGAAPEYSVLGVGERADTLVRPRGATAPGSWLDRLTLTQRRILYAHTHILLHLCTCSLVALLVAI